MTASSTPLEEEITEEDICNHFGETEEEEDAAASTEPHLIDSSVDKGRRLSRQSYEWFQKETNLQVGLLPQEEVTRISRRRSSGLIGANGELRDDFIAKRQSINKPVLFQQLRSIPLLADLTAAKQIVEVDGSVLTQLIVSGYAKMSTKIDELNKINVFPIADGDTGANMKVCLKLPARNLVLDPSPSILAVSSNMAADVLLNGQGNSGTILSHFFVSLAEECRTCGKASLEVNEFAKVLAQVGGKMSTAVPNPVEGTLLSVCRDACQGLEAKAPFQNLHHLLETWNALAQEELRQTPSKLIVDGVKVLEKAGVVDSGAQGFVYCIEGMYLAALGQLPEALDATIFQPAQVAGGDEAAASLHVDHTVTDSKFQYCTEGVVLLKHGLTQKDVLEAIMNDAELGDLVACVGAPAKEGGDMVKIHIHSNDPQKVFDTMLPFSRDAILKKEKVEDMWAMKDLAHHDDEDDMYDMMADAKFTIVGLCDMVLPPSAKSPDNFTLPVFLVPSSTQEPLDTRFMSDSETCNALNCQRHKHTAIRYTTAASNPMQIKIELLGALSRGLPVLVFLMSKDKRISALGRNAMAAISMLSKEQQDLIKVMVHGWGLYEAPFLLKAMDCGRAAKTIDETYDIVQQMVDQNFIFASFASSATVKKLLAWRPGLFPEGFTVESDNDFFAFGVDPVIRTTPLSEFQKAGSLFQVKNRAANLEALEDAEVARILAHLKPDQSVADLVVPCCGRPDYGPRMVDKLIKAGVPLTGKPPLVFNMGFLSLATSSWGEYQLFYTIEPRQEV